MKILLSFFAILFLLPPSTSQKWKADASKSSVSFSLPKGGDEKGSFSLSEAKITYDSLQLSVCSVSAIVDVKSIATGDEGKNAHLLSEEFFNAEKFSKITFTSSKFFQKKRKQDG